jgi:hypothetical protein
MAVCFWYLVKSDMSSVQLYSSVYWTSHILQGHRNHCFFSSVLQFRFPDPETDPGL